VGGGLRRGEERVELLIRTPPVLAIESTAIPLIVSKTVEYVTLPATTSGDQSGTRLHVFDLRVG